VVITGFKESDRKLLTFLYIERTVRKDQLRKWQRHTVVLAQDLSHTFKKDDRLWGCLRRRDRRP
jgi:hypothetical protein